MEHLRLTACLAAEPASIIYIVTGTVGLILARLRRGKRATRSSVAMLFCRKSTRETLGRISLTGSGRDPSGSGLSDGKRTAIPR